MCIASDHLTSLTEVIDKITADFQALNKLQSGYDKELSAKYHEIESATFNVVQGYKLAKEIQMILQKRRAIKGEFARLHSMVSVLKGIGIDDRLVEMRTKLSTTIEKDMQIRSDMKATVSFEDLGVPLS